VVGGATGTGAPVEGGVATSVAVGPAATGPLLFVPGTVVVPVEVVPIEIDSHVHAVGQSALVAQVVALGSQYPGNDDVVVQV
jgi:hypothetical protein